MLWQHLLFFLFPSLASSIHLYCSAILGSSVPQETSAMLLFREQAPLAFIFALSVLSSCIPYIAYLLKNNCTGFTPNNIYFVIYLVIQNNSKFSFWSNHLIPPPLNILRLFPFSQHFGKYAFFLEPSTLKGNSSDLRK